MRIVFMGTAAFGLSTLKRLLGSSHAVEAVVTGPDRPKGRGLRLSPSPIKVLAQEQGLTLLQPERLKDSAFIAALQRLHPDLFVVVAFRILPKEVFEIPHQGTINLHASLLPKYRGAAPIQWAIIRGEVKTGVTTFFIDEGIDTGNIILQREVSIGDDETAGQLHDRLSDVGADVVMETVELIAQKKAVRMPQINDEATPAPKLKKEDGLIDWSKKATDLRNQIRGMNPVPGAHSELNGLHIKIWRASVVTSVGEEGIAPGEILGVHPKEGMIVSTGQGSLSLIELQPQGKKKMSGSEFVRGYRVEVGDTFH